MNTAIDFQQVKASVTIEQVAEMLGVQLKPAAGKLRGKCPICKCDDPRMFVITPEKQLFFCFSEKKGGDALTLVSKVAAAPSGKRPRPSPRTSARRSRTVPPRPRRRRKGSAASTLEAYAKGLDPAHEALKPLGIAEATYRGWKCGYSASGVLRGKLAIPVAAKDGSVAGYVGRALKTRRRRSCFPTD